MDGENQSRGVRTHVDFSSRHSRSESSEKLDDLHLHGSCLVLLMWKVGVVLAGVCWCRKERMEEELEDLNTREPLSEQGRNGHGGLLEVLNPQHDSVRSAVGIKEAGKSRDHHGQGTALSRKPNRRRPWALIDEISKSRWLENCTLQKNQAISQVI